MVRIFGLILYAAFWASTSQVRADEAVDERVRFLIGLLDRRIPDVDEGYVSLHVLLDRNFGLAIDSDK
jgi:hypothetical protein